MKDLWKYISLTLGLALIGVVLFSLVTTSKLKDKVIACQESTPSIEYVEVHDTISVEKSVIQWKTRTKHDTVETIDYSKCNHSLEHILDTSNNIDTIIIVKEILSPLDSFYVNERMADSNIDATIHIEGRGVLERTFIDSVSLDYRFVQQQIIPKKRCCWLRRIFCGCD